MHKGEAYMILKGIITGLETHMQSDAWCLASLKLEIDTEIHIKNIMDKLL